MDDAGPAVPLRATAGPDGEVCLDALPRAHGPLAVEIQVSRAGQDLPPTVVTLDPARRVVAIRRH
jgi:hypothetical protein